MVRFFRRLRYRQREVALLLVTPPPLHEQDWEAFLMVRPCVRACVCMKVGADGFHPLSMSQPID